MAANFRGIELQLPARFDSINHYSSDEIICDLFKEAALIFGCLDLQEHDLKF